MSDYKVGDRVLVKLSGCRIVEATIKAVPGELLFRVRPAECAPYVHPLNVADFKGIRAG
jgi:hypothetical protein